MEEHLNPLAFSHLLQHTLRSLCLHESSKWVYAVYWRILPRNYPPPKWDDQGAGAAFDRYRGNRRNWILAWEDGFCNFASSTTIQECEIDPNNRLGPSDYGNPEWQFPRGLQPELFFKMSHEIYNFGEGLIGKVAADQSHKWVFPEAQDHDIKLLPAWQNAADAHPRTWEAQFQSGIKTIALIAVREGVLQLGAVNKVMEDLSYVVLLRKKFSYLECIPGFLLPHPSSSAFPLKMEDCTMFGCWPIQDSSMGPSKLISGHFVQPPMDVTPSMSSLESLLSKLPSVLPAPSSSSPSHAYSDLPLSTSSEKPLDLMDGLRVVKEENIGNECGAMQRMGGHWTTWI